MKLSLASLALAILLSACAWNPGQVPITRIENAHGSGSVVKFNQDSSLLASGGLGGGMRISRVPDGKSLAYWHGHDDTVNGIVFLADGQLLSAGYDGRIRRWDMTGKMLHEIQTRPVMHMIADEARGFVMTGHTDGAVRIWRLPGLELAEQHALHEGNVDVIAVAWHPATGRYASSGNDSRVFVWTQGQPATELSPPPTDIGTLAFSPDGATLTGGSWFRIFHWKLASGALQTLPTQHRGFIKRLHYSRDGMSLASISAEFDSAVYLLSAADGSTVRKFHAHGLCGEDVAFSPDEHYLASTSDDASVHMWDLRAMAD